jgi:hypothetical protein
MIEVHIDESGTLGMNNHHFIIAALITKDTAAKKRIDNLVQRTKAGFTNPTKRTELKGALMTVPQKQRFLNNLASVQDYSIAYLAADKKHLDPRLFAQKNLTFNFLFGILVKSFIKSYKDDMDICVDNRTVKVTSLNSLTDYVQIEAVTKWGFNQTLSMNLRDSKSCNLLQAVDVVANSIFAHYNYKSSGLYHTNDNHFIRHQLFPYAKFGT